MFPLGKILEKDTALEGQSHMATYFKLHSLNKNMQLLNCFLSYHKLTLLELSILHFPTITTTGCFRK